MGKTSWKKIQKEYIAGGISYRQLAEKYKVPIRTLEDRARAEHWYKLREEKRGKSVAKTIDALSTKQAERAKNIAETADKLLEQITRAVTDEEFPPDAKDIRSLTRALLDIKELQGIKTELDAKEQEARIAVLRKNAADEEKGSIEITLGEGLATLGN